MVFAGFAPKKEEREALRKAVRFAWALSRRGWSFSSRLGNGVKRTHPKPSAPVESVVAILDQIGAPNMEISVWRLSTELVGLFRPGGRYSCIPFNGDPF